MENKELITIEYDNDDYGQWYMVNGCKIPFPYHSKTNREGIAKGKASLICEAFNVFNETNLTPLEMKERIEELEAKVGKYLGCLNTVEASLKLKNSLSNTPSNTINRVLIEIKDTKNNID